ncbi:hypothetical protein K3495_g826 [Podosphaera aphanis]|nr:hypothetical protein K3495_g826 [Podosphaera aphanis]
MSDLEMSFQDALSDFQEPIYRTQRATAIAHGIPKSMFNDRLHGANSSQFSHQHQQRLCSEQEKFLVDWIIDQGAKGAKGYPPSHPRARKVTALLRMNGDQEPLGKNLLQHLLKRNPEILDFSSLIDAAPVKKERFVTYHKAREDGLTEKVIRASWRAAGLALHNPGLVLSSSQIMNRPRTPTQPEPFLLLSLPRSMDNIIDNLSTKDLAKYHDIKPKLLDLSADRNIGGNDDKVYYAPAQEPVECSWCKVKKLNYRGHSYKECFKLKKHKEQQKEAKKKNNTSKMRTQRELR